MTENRKSNGIYLIAALVAVAFLFAIMSTALIVSGKLSRKTKMELEKSRAELTRIQQEKDLNINLKNNDIDNIYEIRNID